MGDWIDIREEAIMLLPLLREAPEGVAIGS